MVALLVTAAACSPAAKSYIYKDSNYHFTFRVPAGWKTPKAGQNSQNLSGGAGYQIQFNNPKSMFVVVQSPQVASGLKNVKNGSVVTPNRDPQCGVKCVFYVIRIAHHRGVLIDEYDSTAKTPTIETALFGTANWTYEMKVRGIHTISPSMQKGFNTVVNSFTIPKNG